MRSIMIEETPLAKIFQGARGNKSYDVEEVIRYLLGLSALLDNTSGNPGDRHQPFSAL
jgi:hypothetical protein